MRLIFCCGLLAGTAFGQAVPAAFPTNEQMRHFKAMNDPRLSPDGKQVLLRVADATADGGRSHLWLVQVNGAPPRQLTFSPDSNKRGERAGEWMPDGSVLFLAHRDEHTSLYRLPMQGGEATKFELKVTPLVDASKLAGALPPNDAGKKDEDKVSPVEIDVENFRVSPDGKTVTLIADDPQTAGEKKQKDTKADAEWVDHGLHGSRLYLLDVISGKLTVVGVDIDVRGASWSADSAKLLVIREEPNGISELGPANSAWMVSRNDAGHAVRLSDVPATVESAAWSPDGGAIYYLAQARRDAPPGFADLYLYTLASRNTRDLTDGLNGSLTGMEPLPLQTGGVVQVAEHGVTSGVIRVQNGGGYDAIPLPLAVVEQLGTNAAQNGWLITANSGGAAPGLLFEAKLGDTPRVLVTPSLVPEHVKSVAPKRISWNNDGLTIEGLLYMPAEATTKKVPLVVDVHGGPLGADLDSYTPMMDFLCGQGWAVLRTNPRGSSGRGADFAAANKNDLGGGDYRDIMAGVDYVLKTENIDPAKTALIGYSYGGEMAGFVEGKTTRFKAIVSMAPVIDQNSEYGTEKGSWYDQWYFGKPWEHEADAWRQSPLSGAAHARTPFLLLQGENDTTDPLGQSQEMYHALRQMKVPVQLVTYPRVDHGPLALAIFGRPSPEPWHGFDARQRIVEFISDAFKP